MGHHDLVPVARLPREARVDERRPQGAVGGYVGYCDTVAQGTPFANGIAMNVGGMEPPQRTTSQGWHIAAARGLPSRLITSVAIDPTDPRTVYVALGGYGRKWAPPGAVGDSLARVGAGHMFKSTDAGEDFTDISGNLPDAPVDSLVVHQGSWWWAPTSAPTPRAT